MQHEFLGLLLSAKTLLRHHHASISLHSCLKDNPPYSIFSRLNIFPMLLKTSSIPCHSHVRAKLLQSDFLWPCRLQPIRLLWPWDSSGKNTRVGCLPSSRASSWPRDQTQVSCIAGRFWANRKPCRSHGLRKKGVLLSHPLQGLTYPTKFSPVPSRRGLTFQSVHCHLRAFA